MLATRRAIVLGVVSSIVIHPKRAVAKTLPMMNELLTDFKRLNDQDAAIIKNDNISVISRWEAIRNNEKMVAGLTSINYDFLLDLYIKTFTFTKPMNMRLKPFARQKMAILYESAKTNEEKALVMQVIAYYELLE
jgi:hypothetical protein